MKTRTLATLSALVIAGTTAGGVVSLTGMAQAGAKQESANARKAAKEAKQARKALAARNAAKALIHAEAAVAFDPQNAAHRALLGEAYLQSGRFTSAAQALADTLSLDPSNGRAALNLALAQIATGDWNTARVTLEANRGTISGSDLGLALALAGDPAGGAAVLAQAARAGGDAKTRQNYALALALAGEWRQAQIAAAVDLPPAEVGKRMMEWASFARPQNSYDQVASLLGVTPVADAGQPAQLALVPRATDQQLASVTAPADPVDVYMPGAGTEQPAQQVADAMAEAPEAAAPVDTAQLATTAMAYATPAVSGITFAPAREVVQALPMSPRAMRHVPVVSIGSPALDRARPLSGGRYYVQLGAYSSSAAARAAWQQISARTATLSGHVPASMMVDTRRGTLHRLSVGGFSRGQADMLCGRIRTDGGNCFVRTSAGDAIAAWAKGVQVAAR